MGCTPHGCQIAIARFLESYVFGPSGFWTMAPLRYAAKFDPFLSLDCTTTHSTLAQSKERKGSNFAIWQPWATGGQTDKHAQSRGERSVGRELSLFSLACFLVRSLQRQSVQTMPASAAAFKIKAGAASAGSDRRPRVAIFWGFLP